MALSLGDVFLNFTAGAVERNNQIRDENVALAIEDFKANKDLYQLVGESSKAGIRTLVDLITNPVHIKGSAVFGSGRRNDRILHQIDRLKARKMLEELKKVFAKGKVKK